MDDGLLPPRAAEEDDHGAGQPTDLTTLAGGLPFESSLHPAGSGRSRWAQQELGGLLGAAWLDDPQPDVAAAGAAGDAPPSGAIWEVERMPSEAEGGVVGLLLSGRRDDPQPGSADRDPADRDQAAWDMATAELPASGMARLTEMLDHLPIDAVTRLTPDDVEVATTAPAPPGVWFWGDDDIYPGKVPGVVESRPVTKRHRLGRST